MFIAAIVDQATGFSDKQMHEIVHTMHTDFSGSTLCGLTELKVSDFIQNENI